MEYRKVFWGAILVIIGTALVLKNLGVIFFSWHSLWHLWPVILILWGISILPMKDWLKLLISLLAIALAILFLYKAPAKYHDDWNWKWDWDNEEKVTSPGQALQEPYDSAIHYVVINLEAAAGSFTIKDTSGQLVEMENKGDIGNYSMEVQQTGDTSHIDLNMHPLKDKRHFKGRGDKVLIRLNPNPVYDFIMDVGAADLEMDLSPFKVSHLELEGGASSIDIKIGSRLPETRLSVEAGASSINLSIPKEAGCELEKSTFLSDKTLPGFTKMGDGKYQTENFQSCTQKIYLELDAAISDVDVKRY